MSFFADLVFILGSATAVVLAFKIAKRSNIFVSVGLSLLINWLVYFLSYLTLLTLGVARNSSTLSFTDALHAIGFVGEWGCAGLAFAALAPTMAAGRPQFIHFRLRRRSGSKANENSVQCQEDHIS